MRIKLLAFVMLFLAVVSAQAEPAKDITQECSITLHSTPGYVSRMVDRNYETICSIQQQGKILVEATEAISGFFLQTYDEYPMEIWYLQGGQWTLQGKTEPYMAYWYNLPEGTCGFCLRNNSGKKVRIAQISIYGVGDRPEHASQWNSLEKCDLMLLVAHPDDDVLWFGGLMPTYAGERGLDVQLVCVAPSANYRCLELLDDMWHCGMTAYPYYLHMQDLRGSTLAKQYELWDKWTLYARVTASIRAFRPEVVVTHDFNGEYGHGAHRAVADAAAYAITAADNPARHKASAQRSGTWQPKKLYVHLYGQRMITMDWAQPLAAFGGKTSMEIATEALACHISQVNNGWSVDRAQAYDNAKFGLYFTTVGDDVLGGDFMENISLEMCGI